MSILRSKEEVKAYEEKLIAIYYFYLYQKGYRKTITGDITDGQAKETKEKYNLSDSVSDLEFGNLEGRIQFSLMLKAYYGDDVKDALTDWVKCSIVQFADKIWHFIFRCAVSKPQISTSPGYDFAAQLDSKLLNPAAANEEGYQDEMNEWHLTPYEFGHLCGFVSAAHWAIGYEWVFNETDVDAPVDWKRFYSYLEKRSSRLKRRKILEMSIIFQILTSPPRNVPKDIANDRANYVQARRLRVKLPGKPVDDGPKQPEVLSWADW